MPPAILTRFLLTLGALCFLDSWAHAQVEPDTSSLVGQVEYAARNGHKRAIRDLMSLVNNPTMEVEARAGLVDLTLFKDQIDVKKASRAELLKFYYDNSEILHFSSLLDAYYCTPIENQATEYKLFTLDAYQMSDRSMHLRKYIRYIDQAVEYKSISDLRDLVEKVADLQILEGQAYLLSLLDGPAGELLSQDLDAFLLYLDQLMLHPSIEVADALFKSEAKGYLRNGSLASYMSRLCNMPFRASWSTAKHKAKYERLLDSLGGLSRVRMFGYSESLPFSVSHFREPVDYYGRILSEPNLRPYVQHNALIDLVASNHPRALFYISTQLLKAQKEKTVYPAVYYLYLLRKLTNLGVAVPDDQEKLVYQLDVIRDRTALVNFVRYWGNHYEDYEYDEHRLRFVNRHDTSLETENLERLFRLLNSENNIVALQAYERLARADPVEVFQLVNKYKDLLRNTNNRVPSLKDGHLQQTVQLTAYAERNRIDFRALPVLQEKLDSLLLELSPIKRIDLENRIIAISTLEDLTAIEYWASINQYDLNAGYSVGRILDYSYTYHWPELIASDAQLRLFIKKAILFERMEGIGISDDYLKKFIALGSAERERLTNLLTSESDKHISKGIKRVLKQNEKTSHDFVELDNFLEFPEQFSKAELAELPTPELEQLSELLWRMNDGASSKAKFLYRTYLDKQLNIEMVPDLMALLIREEHMNQKIPKQVARLLSSIYHYTFDKKGGDQADQWLSYWKANSSSYESWGKEFFGRHIERITNSERVTGPELNEVLRSPYYQDANHRQIVLDALPKLSSNRHLLMLRFDPALAWNERVVLSGLGLKYKDVQDLDKLFPDVPPSELIDYIITESTDFTSEERGKLFNALMRKPWIEELFDDSAFKAHAPVFAEALQWYLEEGEMLSEFEEQNTSLNIARLQFIDKTVEQRLRMSFDLDIDEAARLRIQESILSRVNYKDLPAVMELIPRFAEVNGKRPYNFLNQDFGLPIFNIDAKEVIDTFVSRHQRLSEADLYRTYLTEFGLDIVKEDETLDYGAIYAILRYDIVLPFISGGGNRRDLYTYGVIRLLELTEGTRLGFHEKLNENQLFYSFSASRRAEAWANYLLEKGLVQPGDVPKRPSFNMTTSK